MANPSPFDTALKHLTELSPHDWVVRGGWPAAAAEAVDADIATLTGAADKVIHVRGTPDWLLAVDFQAGHDAVAKLADLLLYNCALFKRHGLLVRSLLVVLHPGADSPRVTGHYERGFPGERFDAALRYRTIRVWEVPAAERLSAGLGLVPLAPLGAVPAADLPVVIAQIQQRLDRDVPRALAVELWSAVHILMGLRYPDTLIETLLQGVSAMEESVTYQAILRKGEAKGEARGEARGETREARKILLLLGRQRFGEPSPAEVDALESVSDRERLEALSLRLLQVASWQELLEANGTVTKE